MFTGIIEETGIVRHKEKTGDGYRFSIEASKVLEDAEIGSSISVNGVCLTVIKISGKAFSVDVIEETLKKTNLGSFAIGTKVNLERAMKIQERLDGHFVLGHVDATGNIIGIKELSNSHEIRISYPEEFDKYLINVGSIAVDGISLTVAELGKDFFKIGIIPHTWENTNFSSKKKDDKVNLEFDVIGKYVERMMKHEKD
jgi:riboflavin synthase